MQSKTSISEKIRNILERQLENGRLAHAYLFVGPKATGKKELAREFAGKVLTISLGDELLRHPDYSVMDCVQDASAESVREFIGRIALKPFIAKRKFALISSIENLNSQGANALLKTLEEPPENTVMVLTADTRRVLPTVVSRCQVFNFNPPPLALRGANREGIFEDLMIMDHAGKPLAERMIAINQFADLEEAELKQKVEDFIYSSAIQLSSAPQNHHRLAAGLKAFEDLQTNKNKKLILQGLLMKI